MGTQRFTTLKCAHCAKKFERRNGDINKARRNGQTSHFCSSKCVGLSQPPRPKNQKPCLACKTPFYDRYAKHCSPSCAKETRIKKALESSAARRRNYITRWKRGEEKGTRGSNGGISNHVRGYLFEKFGSQCTRCGWAEKNPATDNIPLHVEHLDGDWRNNTERNLDLLCPNCHSLTPTYGALNKGNGRPRG